MLNELSRDEYQKIRHIIDDRTNLAARAVISGTNPGWVFADNKDNPETALVWAQGSEGFYLLGNADNRIFNTQLNSFMDGVIKPRSLDMGYTWFEISGTQDEWNDVIEDVFYKRGLQQWMQRVYAHNRKLVPDTKPLMDLTMRIAPLDHKLMSSDLRNIEVVTADIEKYWDSLQEFYNNGFGYAVTWRGIVASMCYIAFADEDNYELGFKSYDPLMRDGLSRAVTVECLKHVLNKRGVAYWDCTDTNVAAYRQAESLGFSMAWEYDCYGFPL